MIERERHCDELLTLLSDNPVVALLGARQVGKTTLARVIAQRFQGEVHFFDLENSAHLAQLSDPLLTLRPLSGLVILDEFHRLPRIFETLRVLVDRTDSSTRFLLLRSASLEHSRQFSESLTGRIAFHQLPGLSLQEVGDASLDQLWFRGRFPRAFTAASNRASWRWRQDFIRTYFGRDLADIGSRVAPATLAHFYATLARYHGQLWNSSELARVLGVSNHTVSNYLNLLTETYLVRVLRPWHANISKRQVKTTKVYLRDSGILHFLLNLGTPEELNRHPKVGASWEGFIVENLIEKFGQGENNAFYWRTANGAELDLVIRHAGAGDELRGFEIKRTVSPRITHAMHIAMADLGLDRLDVIHAGDATFDLAENIRAVAATRILEDIED